MDDLIKSEKKIIEVLSDLKKNFDYFDFDSIDIILNPLKNLEDFKNVLQKCKDDILDNFKYFDYLKSTLEKVQLMKRALPNSTKNKILFKKFHIIL